ncbi:DUF167 domain-containing protein [Patescibacteria group bacterium]|nr:DUF167 domain-containing protein [Patescibacteria group bacterium]
MKIFVSAKPRAREEKVERVDENNFIVSVTAPPVKGLANQAIIKVVAGYFKVAPSRVKIVSGFTSRQKVLEII